MNNLTQSKSQLIPSTQQRRISSGESEINLTHSKSQLIPLTQQRLITLCSTSYDALEFVLLASSFPKKLTISEA